MTTRAMGPMGRMSALLTNGVLPNLPVSWNIVCRIRWKALIGVLWIWERHLKKKLYISARIFLKKAWRDIWWFMSKCTLWQLIRYCGKIWRSPTRNNMHLNFLLWQVVDLIHLCWVFISFTKGNPTPQKVPLLNVLFCKFTSPFTKKFLFYTIKV